jgi:signal transduction histidine kinase
MASDLERVMRELQLERDTVTALLTSRRELVANASHELRTPVATLRGYLESTLLHWDDLSNSALQQDFVVMEHEVLHLQTLVEDLFSLARADIGRLSLGCEPTDIGSLVEHIVAVRAPLAWLVSKIELVADLPSDLPCALVDATYVELVLQNLLHIALRHTPPGGIVAVVVAVKDACVLIQVKDTGPCLSSGDLAAPSDSLSPDGSVGMLRETGGLGLALVKQWTESMGGQFILESIPGEGSCFQVCFPSTISSKPGALIEAC